MIDRTTLGNSFEFIVTAGARARQLLNGSTPRVAPYLVMTGLPGMTRRTTKMMTEVSASMSALTPNLRRT